MDSDIEQVRSHLKELLQDIEEITVVLKHTNPKTWELRYSVFIGNGKKIICLDSNLADAKLFQWKHSKNAPDGLVADNEDHIGARLSSILFNGEKNFLIRVCR